MPSCLVYRSEKKQETYLFLAIGTSLEDLPEGLRDTFGEAAPVMKLDVEPTTKLAQADAGAVIEALERDGFYLQLPPTTSVEELLNRKFG